MTPAPRIVGAPTPEEVAAVLAVLAARAEVPASRPAADAFTRWRRRRQAVLRRGA